MAYEDDNALFSSYAILISVFCASSVDHIGTLSKKSDNGSVEI